MSQPQLVRTARCFFFEIFRQRWVTVTTTGNPFHRDYVPHGSGSSYPVKFHLHHELAKLITELLREFPGCADILLTYDDQEILHELYDQNHIGIHMIGRKYSCNR